jgi:hypothetical protein
MESSNKNHALAMDLQYIVKPYPLGTSDSGILIDDWVFGIALASDGEDPRGYTLF